MWVKWKRSNNARCNVIFEQEQNMLHYPIENAAHKYSNKYKNAILLFKIIGHK